MPIFSLLSFLTGLTFCAVSDLFSKEIKDEYQLFLLAAGLPLFIETGGNIGRFVACIVLLIIFLLLYKFTENFIGGGDIKLFLTMVLVTGFRNAFLSFSVGFLFSGIFAVFYISINFILRRTSLKEAKKGTIPFVPFLLIGALIIFLNQK